MTTFTIIGETKGAPDNSQTALLHIYNQTLATGARSANGSGTGLGLVVWEEAIGVINAGGFVSKIVTAATEAQTLTLPNETGTVVLGNGAGVTDAGAFRTALGEGRVVLDADFDTTSDTPQAVTGFTLPLAVSSTYHLKAVLRVQSASNTNGIRPRLTGPAASLSDLTAIARRSDQDFPLRAFDEDADFGNMEATDSPEILTIEGILTTNATAPASDLGISVKSESNGTEVSVLAGSLLTLTKI